MASIRSIIESKGTRYKFAKKMGVRWATVDNWCKAGRIPMEQCKKASEILGVPREKLNREFA